MITWLLIGYGALGAIVVGVLLAPERRQAQPDLELPWPIASPGHVRVIRRPTGHLYDQDAEP